MTAENQTAPQSLSGTADRTPGPPRSITAYHVLARSGPQQADGACCNDGVEETQPWLVEELRGPERHPFPSDEEGAETEPGVVVHYPPAVRSPEQWSQRLPAHLSGQREDAAAWPDLLHPSDSAEWQRGMAAVVRAMRPAHDQAADGLTSMFERAGYALLSTLLSDPGPVAPHPTLQASRTAGPQDGTCPAAACSARWSRADTAPPGPVGLRTCGCAAEAPCLWAWSARHMRPQRVEATWDALRAEINASALIQAARAYGISPTALGAVKGRPPRQEGGLWARAAQEWDFRGPLSSRVYGVPVIMLTPASRWLVNGSRSVTMMTQIFGYLDDVHLDSSLAGPQGPLLARAARQELRAWARTKPLRETALLQALTSVWNTLLEAVQHHPGTRIGGPPLMPRYESLSCGERKLILTVDTCLTYLATAHDADEQTLDDLAMCQALNGYSDLGADMALGVVNNGLLLAAGRGAIPGHPDAQDAYRAMSRTILAIARTGAHRPAAQAVADTVLWNITNGRHNLVERATGMPYPWLEQQWPVLRDNRRDWDEVENNICDRLEAAAGRRDSHGTGQREPACAVCGPLDRWMRVLHDVLDDLGSAACAITRYVTGQSVHSTRIDSGGVPSTPGSDCAGAIALMIRRFGFSRMLDDLCWLLAGVIWFREAIHLRGCVVDLAGDTALATAALPHGDW